MNIKMQLAIGIGLFLFWSLASGTGLAESNSTNKEVLRLGPPSDVSKDSTTRSKTRPSSPFDLNSESTRRVVSSLAVVIGGFLLVVVLTRLQSRKRAHVSNEMIRVIGRKAITPKHNLHLVQVHNKILLLVETSNGLQKLESIDNVEPDELLAAATDVPAPKESEADRLLKLIQNRNLSDTNLNFRNTTA